MPIMTREFFVPGRRYWLLVAWCAVAVWQMINPHLAEAATGSFQETETSLRNDYARAQQDFGPDSPQSATALALLANHVSQDGSRTSEVLSLVEQLERIDVYAFGPGHEEVAFALQWQGAVLLDLGDSAEALRRLERSLAIYESASGGEQAEQWIAIVLSRIGMARKNLGDLQGTLDATTRALSISESLFSPDSYRLGIAHNNQGLALKELGVYAKALHHFDKALAIASNALGENDRRVTTMIGNIGAVYLILGDLGSAELMFQRRLALVEQRADKDQDEKSRALNDLANLHDEKGELERAVQLYEQCWNLMRNSPVPDNAARATVLNNLAVTHAHLRHYGEAIRLHEQALSLQERAVEEDSPAVALSLTNLAVARTDSGVDASASLPMLFRAVRIYSSTGRREGLWQTQNTLRQSYQSLGKYELAVLWGKESVNTLQSLRGELSPLVGNMQAAFLEKKSGVYQELADLLISQGRVDEAQQVMQALKEYELFESLDQRAGVTPRFADLSLTEMEHRASRQFALLRDEVAALTSERRQLEARRRSGRLDAEGAIRLEEIVQQWLPAAEQAMSSFLGKLEMEWAPRKEAEHRATDSSRLRLAIESLSVSEPQARAVGLQYLLAEDRLSIILTAPGVPPIAQQVAIDRAQLRRQVGALQLLLANPESDQERVEAALTTLRGILFGPSIAKELRRVGARTLILSLEDVLRYVPFAALTDGQRYVIEDYVLSVYNEAASKALFATKAPLASQVAAFGMSQAIDNLPPLKAVPSELKNVVRQSNTVGSVWLDRQFTRPRFQESLNAGFNVLHLASHFVLTSGRPDLSSLILGDGSRLSLADISRDKLRFDDFDLVAFSACQTAVGVNATGREVESLAAKTQQQGAHAVLATLWRINDGSTSEFMSHFYGARSSGRMNSAEALREAQLRFISGSYAGKKVERWTMPYYWAPFVLMGNWR